MDHPVYSGTANCPLHGTYIVVRDQSPLCPKCAFAHHQATPFDQSLPQANHQFVIAGPAECLKHGVYHHDGASIRCPLCLTEEQLNRPPIMTTPVLQYPPHDIAPNLVNPPHYTKDRRFETFDVIEDWFHGNFTLGQVAKYISRAGRKGPALNDLLKAKWYLDKEIKRVGDKNG